MSSEQAYQELINRIADDEPHSGWPADVDLLKEASPLTDDETALVCSLHTQAVIDEFAFDPTLLARFLRREIDSDELLNQLRLATEGAVWEALRDNVLEECSRRNEERHEHSLEDYYGGSATLTPREQAEHDFGVRSLFR